MKLKDPARPKALEALLSLWQQGGMLEEQNFGALKAGDRARAFRLTRETVRQEAGFDFIIKKAAAKKPSEPIRAILHLGLFEILCDEAEPYGVVNEWVEIAKTQAQSLGPSRFVNALLREAARSKPRLNPNNQFGKALRKHLMGQYSSSVLDQVNKVQSSAAPVDLCLKAGLDLEEWATKLGGMPLLQSHGIRLSRAAKISELEGFDEGAWWVQDFSAALAVRFFGDLRGKKALDLCAAPGGKAMQLADLGAELCCVEISAKRARVLEENLARTKLEARVLTVDALRFEEQNFDAVLLDAPCSATGTIRRHPDLRFHDPLGRMKALGDLQFDLLSHAYCALAAGGELIYATCSLLKEEGEGQIERFLRANPKAKLCPLHSPFTGEPQDYLRILPCDLADIGGCDGFFIAKIQKDQ